MHIKNEIRVNQAQENLLNTLHEIDNSINRFMQIKKTQAGFFADYTQIAGAAIVIISNIIDSCSSKISVPQNNKRMG